MPIRQPRKVTPHLWTTLAAASATACLVTGAPVGAAGFTSKQTQAAFGLTLPKTPTLIAAEGGEGGESGAMAGVSPDIAYLTRLALVEGHIKAAVLLYAKGMTTRDRRHLLLLGVAVFVLAALIKLGGFA